MKNKIAKYLIQLGDNCLILGQRLGELCGHGPALEIDIALTNISLDLLGQTRAYFQYAAEMSDDFDNEDQIAFLRKSSDYRNCHLTELPNTDFAHTIIRQFLFDQYHQLLLTDLMNSNDEKLKAIATKSIKEVNYHLRFSKDWVIRLGDGTETSKVKMQEALNTVWRYTEELLRPSELDIEMEGLGIGTNPDQLKEEYFEKVKSVLQFATLEIPENKFFGKGGKEGVHTEHFGYILSDLQYMQRTYPNQQW